MSTAELVTLIKSRYGEDGTGQVSATQIVAFLNSAQMELCSKGNILPACATLDLTTGVQDYALPSNFHRIQAVFLKRTTGTLAKRLLEPIGIQQVDPAKPPGDPEQYFVWGANDSVTGLHTYYIGFQRVPNYTTTDKPVEIFYRRLPALMVSGGADPEVDAPWQEALVEGALMMVYQRLVSSDPTWAPVYSGSRQRWNDWLEEAEAHIPNIIIDRPFSPLDSWGYASGRRWY